MEVRDRRAPGVTSWKDGRVVSSNSSAVDKVDCSEVARLLSPRPSSKTSSNGTSVCADPRKMKKASLKEHLACANASKLIVLSRELLDSESLEKHHACFRMVLGNNDANSNVLLEGDNKECPTSPANPSLCFLTVARYLESEHRPVQTTTCTSLTTSCVLGSLPRL